MQLFANFVKLLNLIDFVNQGMKLIFAFQLNTNWVWCWVVAHMLPISFNLHFLSFPLFPMKNSNDAFVSSLREASKLIYFLSLEKFKWCISFLFLQCEVPTTFFFLMNFCGILMFCRHESLMMTFFFFCLIFMELQCSIGIKVLTSHLFLFFHLCEVVTFCKCEGSTSFDIM